MTFLNPWALLGLAAAAIPILLHLFNLRKLRTVEFSTLRFLKELQKTSVRKLKLRQLLLLFVRTLLILCVVLAFSRPTFQGSIPLFLANEARTTAVLLFDDSYSMQSQDEQGTYLAQAKNAAHTILTTLKEGDECVLVRFSECRAALAAPVPLHSFQSVHQMIDRIEPVAPFVPLPLVLKQAQAAIASSFKYNREVYILSDFQEGLFDARSVKEEVVQKFPEHTQLYLLSIGRQAIRNASILQITIPTVLFLPHKPYTVRVTVANTGTTPLRNHSISIYQSGTRVAEKSVDLDVGQREVVEFSLISPQVGTVSGRVVLENDDVEFDNTRVFALTIPERVRLSLIGKPDDVRYLRTALSLPLADSLSAFELRETDISSVSSSLLNSTDVAFLASSRELSAERASILISFLQRGGALVVFPSEQFFSSYTSLIADPSATTRIEAVENLQSVQQSSGFVEFSTLDKQHPVFADMFEPERMAPKSERKHQRIESPLLTRYARLRPTSYTQTLIQLSTGTPFLTEDMVGKGRLFVFAVSATPVWSDFPLRGLFVPLLHRMALYSAQALFAPVEGLCGEEVMLSLPPTRPKTIIVASPDGTTVPVNSASAEGIVVRYTQTTVPGVYNIKDEKRILRSFAVNVDERESTPPLPGNEIKKRLEKYVHRDGDVHLLHPHTSLRSSITEGRYGVELSSYFLALAILCALVEIVLAHSEKNQKPMVHNYD